MTGRISNIDQRVSSIDYSTGVEWLFERLPKSIKGTGSTKANLSHFLHPFSFMCFKGVC